MMRLRGLRGHRSAVRVGATIVALLVVGALFVNWFSLTERGAGYGVRDVSFGVKALTLSWSASGSATTQTEYYWTFAKHTQNGVEFMGFVMLLAASAAAIVGLALAIFVAITNRRRPLFSSTFLLVVSVVLGLLGVTFISGVVSFFGGDSSWRPSGGFVLLVAATVVGVVSYQLGGRTKSA